MDELEKDIEEELTREAEEEMDEEAVEQEILNGGDRPAPADETQNPGAGKEEGEEEKGGEERDKKESRRKEKKEKKDKRDDRIAELEDRVRRQMAEFDNFRKRSEKEKSFMFEIGAKSVVEKILPVVDNFERGLQSVPEGEKDSPFAEGMGMIYKQLMTGLEELGVKPIEAVGKEFDPDIHNAVMHVEDEELGENVVAEELQKGYMYKDSVVRHSMVKVAN